MREPVTESFLAAPAEHDRPAVMSVGTIGPGQGRDDSHVHACTYAQAVAELLRLQPG